MTQEKSACDTLFRLSGVYDTINLNFAQYEMLISFIGAWSRRRVERWWWN